MLRHLHPSIERRELEKTVPMMKLLFPMAALLGAFVSAVAGAESTRTSTQRAVDPAAMGFLDVSSEPAGAEILIDDADLGKKTPQHQLPVLAGHHRLTLVGDAAHKLTVGFSVEAGKTKALTLYLAK